MLFIFLQMSLKSQTLNFLDKADFNNGKKAILYTYASWCGENKNDYNTIKDSLLKYRHKYDLQLLIDTVTDKHINHNSIIELLKPEKVTILNAYFPKRLSKRAENDQYTKYVNTFYNSKFFLLGPSTLLMIDSNKTQVLQLENRLQKLSDFLNSTSN